MTMRRTEMSGCTNAKKAGAATTTINNKISISNCFSQYHYIKATANAMAFMFQK